jgi:hypothetical protein
VEEPIYHLAVLEPLEQRRAKIERYRRTTSHLRIGGKRPVSETYYLPETTSRRKPAPVPEQDRPAVQAVLRGSAGPLPRQTHDARHVPLSESDRFYAGRSPSAAGLRASIALFERDLAFASDEQRALLLRVANEGTEIWPWGLERSPHIHLSYQCLSPATEVWIDSGVITPLPHTLKPGDVALMPITIIAPADSGRHRIRPGLRHAGHGWFGLTSTFEIFVS